MGESFEDPSTIPPDIVERETLCLSRPSPGMVVQGGEEGFKEELLRLYDPAECNAAEQLVKLKEDLKNADSDSFWRLLTVGLTKLAGSQWAFVSKRILIDDESVAVEMPPLGEPGSCFMGAALYFNDGHGKQLHFDNFKYHAYSCPCAYMKHDKIFIIPDKLNEFILQNPNELPMPGEAYLGLPLFADGKCFAHFGVMWSAEGAAQRSLSWGYLEMMLHSLEDIILDRVLRGEEFAKSAERLNERPTIIPHESISIAQSLKPYARSLSHELRTPMQGVVGMLDVMMANVKEAQEGLIDSVNFLDILKSNIESIQDSTRRAVEAADNVVHAYDMNMGVPETPLSPLDSSSAEDPFAKERRPDILVTGNDIAINQFRGVKRKREGLTWTHGYGRPVVQPRVSRTARQRPRYSFSEEPPARGSITSHLSKKLTDMASPGKDSLRNHRIPQYDSDTSSSPIFASEHGICPGLRHTRLREVLNYVINDALKVGGRPDSAMAEQTDLGEIIEVRTRTSSGQANMKIIEYMVAPDVPETILIDEKDLAKMISCVVLNAIKFTDNGNITLKATLSLTCRYIVINVKDSGSGIPAAFLPNLFKPFSREDDSTTRQSEGLGLGLMVAKGLARKLGGDLLCLRSHVSGPQKGSEFELRVPLNPGEPCSRPASPFGSPSPSLKSRLSAEVDAGVAPMYLPGTQQPTTPPLTSDPFKKEDKESPRGTPGPPFDTALKAAHGMHHLGLPSPRRTASPGRPRGRATSKSRSLDNASFDRQLAKRYPLKFLVVEDNSLNRRLLISMLQKLGYTDICEAYDGNSAVEQMRKPRSQAQAIDVVLMDLWMPLMDGFQASDAILKMGLEHTPTILAISADVTDGALERAAKVGMKGYLTKPFQIRDLEKLITQYCASRVDSEEE